MYETFGNKGLFAASAGNEGPGDSAVVCAFYCGKFKKLLRCRSYSKTLRGELLILLHLVA